MSSTSNTTTDKIRMILADGSRQELPFQLGQMIKLTQYGTSVSMAMHSGEAARVVEVSSDGDILAQWSNGERFILRARNNWNGAYVVDDNGNRTIRVKRYRLPKHLTGLRVGHLVELTEDTGDAKWTKGVQATVEAISDDKKAIRVKDDDGNEALLDANRLSKATPRAALLDTVIMPDGHRQQIFEALEQIRQHDLIFTEWGFDGTVEKGKGVSMLFYGPPGTGKTLVSQGIADHLKRKLVIISTADIQSSTPGESERNIRKHFKDAKGSDTVILFDECDSLLYSRSGTGPILGAQINELLSQLERFDGLTLFTTNRLGTLDEAVNRRLALKLKFDMPSAEERARIWQRMFPAKAPLDDGIDWAKLASVEITGGYIKNCVLRAARMAAIEDKPDKEKRITMKHLRRALIEEFESLAEFDEARAAHNRGRITVPSGENAEGERVIRRAALEGKHGR